MPNPAFWLELYLAGCPACDSGDSLLEARHLSLNARGKLRDRLVSQGLISADRAAFLRSAREAFAEPEAV